MPASLIFSPILERALLYVSIAIATLVAFTNWRRGDTRAFREPLIAFFALWFVEGALLAVAAAPSLLPFAFVQGLDLAAIMLLGWGFLASSLPARIGAGLLGVGLTFVAAFSAFAISAARAVGGEPAWLSLGWSTGSLVVAGGTAVLLTARRLPDRTSGAITAFAALTLSAALDILILPDLARITRLIGFSLFPIGLYQRAIGDLRGMHDTLREFSQSALKQTQELVTLLEASTYLFTSFDLDELMKRVVEHAAVGIDADRAAILLADPAAPQTMRVSCGYPRGAVDVGQTFLLNTQPALVLAMSSGETTHVGPRGQGAAQLMRLLNSERLGPMIVQPLATQDSAIGVFVAANTGRAREFSDGQMRLLAALGAQMAAAIANAQLYRGLDAQARELARVLATREHEVGWYASILESIGDGVIVADKSDQVVIANSAVPRLLDTPLEYIVRRPLGQLFERMTPVGDSTDPAPRKSDVVHAAFAFGDATLHVSLTPVHSLRGERLGKVVVIRDITAQRRHAHSRAEFMGRLAHELRAPLAAARGYADLLAKGAAGELPPKAADFARTIRANADRATAQVEAVLQFNELDRGRIPLNVEEADVASLLADAAEAHHPRCDARRIALDVQVKPNLPSVRADRARARQALDQLIDNAIKFTPDGGRVTLSAAPSWDGLSDRPAGVAVSVADTGIGFDREQRARLFETFYRGEHAPADTIGLGIGLSIARGLIEAMGGQVWARGEKDRGASFTFTLPIARVADAHTPPATTDAPTIEAWIEQALTFLEDEGH